jgi:hypothetical protein
MIAELWILYVTALTLISVFALFARSFRRNLRRADVLILIVPFLAWVALVFTNFRPKGLTDGATELVVLGFVAGIVLVVRAMFPEWKVTTRPVVLSVVVAVFLWAFKPPFFHYDLVGAYLYVNRHSEVPLRIRDAILSGVVVAGMSADQAAAAGGPYLWTTTNGQLKRLSFNNRSQFRSDRPVAFNAYIVDGQVSEIERLIDLDSCRDFIRNPKPESIDYPYVGFWKTECMNNFGLRFERGGSGLYGIHFCGPGGCGDIDACTRIPDGRNYELVDANTVLVDKINKYKRCERDVLSSLK